MKQRNILLLFNLFGFLILTSGCVASSGIPSVQATSAQDANITGKSTFAWYQDKPVAGQDLESGFTTVLDKHLRRAIEEELLQKGISKVTENPDLFLAYDVSLSVPIEKDKPAFYAPGFGYSYAYEAGYRYKYGTARIEGFRPVDLFKEGTLIIDVIEPGSEQLIWRGWSEGTIIDFDSKYSKVQEKVKSILGSYPVPVRE